MCGGQLDVLQGDGDGPVHTAHGDGGPRTDGGGPDPVGAGARAVPSGPVDLGQGGRGEQLRARLLLRGATVRGPDAGRGAAVRRVVQRRAGVHRVPLDGRRHGVRADGCGVREPAPRVRQEEPAAGVGAPGAARQHRSGGAVQRRAGVAQNAAHVRLRVHGGQRGDIRHQRRTAGGGPPDVRQPEPHCQPGGVVHHRVAAVPRAAERGHQRVPDEPGAVPARPLPAAGVRAARVCAAHRARPSVRRGHHRRVLRPRQPHVPAGRARARRRPVHRVLHAVPRRRGGQGRQRSHQSDPHRPPVAVRRLVSHRLQGGHQRPAARGRRVRDRRDDRRRARRVHDGQHDGHSVRVDTAVPQVRPHVPKARVHPLVRGRRHGKGRVQRGSRGHRNTAPRLPRAGPVRGPRRSERAPARARVRAHGSAEIARRFRTLTHAYPLVSVTTCRATKSLCVFIN